MEVIVWVLSIGLIELLNHLQSKLLFLLSLLFTLLWVFLTSVSWWIFHWSVSESKSLQVCQTLHRILADLNNGVVWMVSTHRLISKSFCLYQSFCDCTEHANSNCFHRHFHVSLFFLVFFLVLLQVLGTYLSFYFTLWSAGTVKSTIRQRFFFFVVVVDYRLSSDRYYVIRLYLKIRENFVHFFLKDGIWVVRIPLSIWSDLNCLHNSQWIPFPT